VKSSNTPLHFNKGDKKVFGNIYNRFFPAVLFFAKSFVADRQEAEDIAMDSFRKLWESRESFNNVGSIQKWLKVTTRNACINRLRNRKMISGKQELLLKQADSMTEADILKIENIEGEVIQRILNEIDQLPEKCRDAFVLRFLGGLRHQEIADIMHISPHTVKNHLQKAVSTLKVKLLSTDFLLLVYILTHSRKD